jgi:hypothetical protein
MCRLLTIFRLNGTFLKEKSLNEKTRRFTYTHRKLRSARDSTKRHLPYLFTFERYLELNIPDTTNSLDGSFGKVKRSIGVHSGLSHEQKMKMVMTLLGGKLWPHKSTIKPGIRCFFTSRKDYKEKETSPSPASRLERSVASRSC